VVVAARNEAANIRQCLLSLTQQSYEIERFEIIVVDDHSEDQTVSVADQIASGIVHPRITVLSSEVESGQSGKSAAIALGIERAQGEIILCTDADCIVPKEWISSTIRCFEQSVVFVAGPVNERATGSFISNMQSLEFLGLLTTGAGLIGSGSPIICNGANIAYRKSAFREVNGYGENRSSCDDETLMQRMVKRNTGKVVFNFDRAATVTTSTPDTLIGFWNQRTRWAAKRGHYEDKLVLARLLALYAFFLVVFLTALVGLLDTIIYLPLLVILTIKVAAELIVLAKGARLFQQRVSVRHFLIAELLHVPYIVIAALVGQLGALRWKNRTLEQ
jgi:cellulose synthase/poly-beta-1,6-N-acetylglucosamine synthase-like glycosyltransferase